MKLIVTVSGLECGGFDIVTGMIRLANPAMVMFAIGHAVLFVAITGACVVPRLACLGTCTGPKRRLGWRCTTARRPGISVRSLKRDLGMRSRAKIRMAKKGGCLIVNHFRILPFQASLLYLFRYEFVKGLHTGPGVTDGFYH